MHITTFEAKDFVRKRSDGLNIRVNPCRLIISAGLVKHMGLKVTDRALLHQDNYQPDIWYLSIDPKGFKLTPASKSAALNLNSSELASMILKAFGLKKDDHMYFCAEEDPVEHEGVKYWKLRAEIAE